MRDEVKTRMPLLNTTPRRYAPSRYAPRSLKIIHVGTFRKVPGVTIETLFEGDGRSFPLSGQGVRRTVHEFRITKTSTCDTMTKGFELALMSMSVGEKAKITVSRELLYLADGASKALDGEQSRTLTITLHSIE